MTLTLPAKWPQSFTHMLFSDMSKRSWSKKQTKSRLISCTMQLQCLTAQVSLSSTQERPICTFVTSSGPKKAMGLRLSILSTPQDRRSNVQSVFVWTSTKRTSVLGSTNLLVLSLIPNPNACFSFRIGPTIALLPINHNSSTKWWIIGSIACSPFWKKNSLKDCSSFVTGSELNTTITKTKSQPFLDAQADLTSSRPLFIRF